MKKAGPMMQKGMNMATKIQTGLNKVQTGLNTVQLGLNAAQGSYGGSAPFQQQQQSGSFNYRQQQNSGGMNQLLPRGERQYEPQPGVNPHSYYKEYYRNEYLDRLEGFLRKVGIKPKVAMNRKDRKRLQRIKEALCYENDSDEEREKALDEQTEEDLGTRRYVKGYQLVPLYQ